MTSNQDISQRLAAQAKEFDAATAFVRAMNGIHTVAVVDDDYPEVRHRYESALADLMAAMASNGRFEPGGRYGLMMVSGSSSAGAVGRYCKGDEVEKIGGDYTFVGHIVSVFEKRSDETRYVVEDDRGVLHIYSAKNLRPREAQRHG